MGLILVLAVGSQVLASRLRIPALIMLLFLVRADGRLVPAARPAPGDTSILLLPGPELPALPAGAA